MTIKMVCPDCGDTYIPNHEDDAVFSLCYCGSEMNEAHHDPRFDYREAKGYKTCQCEDYPCCGH